MCTYNTISSHTDHFEIQIKALQSCNIPPPRDFFNAEKIILKLDLFMQSFKNIGKE